MKWGEVNHSHNQRRARVWAPSTPDFPLTGDPGTVGTIIQYREQEIPLLRVGERLHYYAWWYEVDLLD